MWFDPYSKQRAQWCTPEHKYNLGPVYTIKFSAQKHFHGLAATIFQRVNATASLQRNIDGKIA